MPEPFAALELNRLESELARPARRRATAGDGASKFQEKRRNEALQRQQQARLDRAQQARQLAHGGPAQADAAEPVADAGRGGEAGPSPREDCSFYARQLMQPEWMIEVPANLPQEWFVMPRPEGQRCLVIASQGCTVSRLRNGRVLHRWQSWLPGGSRASLAGSDGYCILDCVFAEAAAGSSGAYCVLDLMCWRGHALYGCSAEFRLFWRDAKLAEERPPGEAGAAFPPVPAHAATPEGVAAAHSAPVPFPRDGCYFLHREGQYDTEGPSPLALLWKDAACSRFFVDTDAGGAVSEHQHCVLQYGEGRAVCTGDCPPVVLARMPADFASRTAAVLRPGRLLRFTLRAGGIAFLHGEPVGADLHFEGAGNQRRGRADTLSKIMFQRLARTQPISLGHFGAAAAAAAAAGQAA